MLHKVQYKHIVLQSQLLLYYCLYYWEALQERVYHGRQFATVEQLKQAIVEEWRALSQNFIDRRANDV
jgi:hypothetical protein